VSEAVRKILARIANVRGELNEIEALLRAMGANKAQGRLLAGLRESVNDLEREAKREEAAE
jgi:hypothetical protein